MKSLIFQNLSKIALIACFVLLNSICLSQVPDFKVQHIQDDVARTGGTNTSFTPVSALSKAVELANNNRKTQSGSPTSSSDRNGDDMAGARQLTSVNTLTYYRESNSSFRDMRFNTSIWEYIGPSGGGNELIVRGRYAVNLNGTSTSVTQALTGITNANKCIPFITGIMNNATNEDSDSGTAIAYLENAATLRVQKGSNDNNVRVYITLVEFTGSNWTVLHGNSGSVSADSGTITLRNGSDGTGTATNVTSWSDAVIFSQFRGDNTASGNNDNISDLWPIMKPGSNNQLVDWTFNTDHDSNGTNRHFVHVLVNSGLNVTRFQNGSNSAGETTINIASAGLSDENQAFIVGSSITSGNVTEYGKGWRNYYLKSATQAAHWSHRSGDTSMSHELQIIDLSGLQTTYPGVEINVKGNGLNIPSGNTNISTLDDTDFGSVQIAGATSVHTFTIQNLGSSVLNLTNPSPFVSITGATSEFTLTTPPNGIIPAGGSTTFTVTFDPTISGTHTATISIANNDIDENPYTFIIQGMGGYCDSYGNTIWDDGITYVSFNTINNADILKDVGYEDFTNISTNVYRGSIHDLTVRVNTDGNYRNYALVWIDWNRDGDFDDAGEQYDMGSVSNVVDGPTSNSPLSITVPLTAVIGATRMRVSTKYNSYPSSSCEEDFDGEVEDYTVNIIDNLIDFNGANGYIDFTDNHDLTGSFSLESWVFQESAVATGTIISKGNIDASNKTGYHFSLKNNYPNLIWYGNSNNMVVNITSPFAIPNNQWHHIAATFNGSTVKMYIDGIEVVSATASSAPLNTVNNFKIGSDTANSLTSPLQYNFFNGAIQEVRIWDVALSESQIREMMNQHIQQNATNIKGIETQLTISGGLLWSHLRGYYRLDSNTAIDSSSYTIDGIPQNMAASQIITAPLPYKTNSNGAWDTAATWLNNSNIYLPNTMGINGTTAIDWNIVELSYTITSGNRDISLLGLVSLSGKLTINGLTDINTGTGTGQSLTISHYLELDGVIDLEGESQLIQLEGSIIDTDSGGYIERDQQGTANGFNYNYWSSSVGPISGNSATRGTGISKPNSNYTISGMMNDGTSPSSYLPINFSSSYSAADSNTPTTPRTISSYWMYKYFGPSGDYSAWAKINEMFSLVPGEGFTLKGTSGSVSVESNQNYVFKGLPYNSDITIPLNKISGTDDVERLIGNPYPSAIDARAFIKDNLSAANGGNNTVDVFNGTIYFWDHFGQEDSHTLGNYVGGYATFNLTGGVPAISNDFRINNNGQLGTKTPGDFIPVSQGFFVSTVGATGGNVIFKNSQRVFEKESTSSSVFLKTTQTKSKTNNEGSKYSNPLIRLMYDSPEGYHRQIVIGANENASLGFDIGYDAVIADLNQEDMYWTFDSRKFVIQGVNNFNDEQEFSIGLIVNKGGLIKIKMDQLENIDTNKSIYIKDNVTEETFQINDAPFEIYLDAGTYNDRFKLVFQPNQKSLDVDDLELKNEFITYYDNQNSNLIIILKSDAIVNKGSILNILGQEIQAIGKFSNRLSIPLKVSNGAYIIQLETDKGLINKKIIIN